MGRDNRGSQKIGNRKRKGGIRQWKEKKGR